MRIKNILSIPMLLISGSVLAGPGTGSFNLKAVHIENGDVYLVSETTLPDPLDCGINTMIKLNKDDAGFNEMYSLALTAHASGKTVKFWLRACDSAPWAGDIAKAYAGQITN